MKSVKWNDYGKEYDITFGENNLTVNGLTVMVEADPKREFVYKLYRRPAKIIAIDGVEGLEKYMSKCIDEKFCECYVEDICKWVGMYGKQI